MLVADDQMEPVRNAAARPRAPTRPEVAALALILVVGLALRLMALANALHTPRYTWQDSDGYMAQALRLAGPDGWSWTFDAVTYTINGQRHALPPGYSVFLSLFALWPGFPLSAQVAQICLAVAAIAMVFALGRRVHSTRAGLIAAAIVAVWVPNIFVVWSTSQEMLYLPLILAAFLLLVRTMERDDPVPVFGLVGLVFGAAALTRSMPLFFALPAACLHVALSGNRRRAAAQGLAFLLGFMLVTVPYSTALSRQFGQLTVIDTHGSIHLEPASGTRAPSPLETAERLWQAVSADPALYFRGCVARARSLFHVNGGRILQIYVVADSRPGAAVWKSLVHLGSDAVLILGAVLAGVGAAVCRRPRIAVVLLLWTAINIGIASLGGFGGARLRTPFEPFLIVLAAVVPAGGWRRPHPAALAGALAAAIVAAIAVMPQVPGSLRSWPDYGVIWPSIFDRPEGRFTGSAGLNVPAYDGVATLTATATGPSTILLRLRVGGVHVRTIGLPPGEASTVHARWPPRGLAFIELDQVGGDPATVEVRVPGR
ncbi:MAG TPA: glycosyltransferase family 39 protein [Vicinamibacterales bacterium]|nr:glycosyltransferase family 39 protein [Vicinamibacterales bacterium]